MLTLPDFILLLKVYEIEEILELAEKNNRKLTKELKEYLKIN